MPAVKEPAWLTAMVDQRLALIVESGALTAARETGVQVVMTPLAEPESEDADIERFERTCDRCGAYVEPESDQFYTGTVSRQVEGVMVYMSLGLCAQHAKEVQG